MMRLHPALPRAAAIGLLLLPLLLLGGGFLLLRQMDSWHAELTQKVATLARLAMARDRLEAQKAELLARSGGAATVLDEAEPAIAGANLQRIVASLVTAQGGSTDSLLVLPPGNAGDYQEIGLRATFSATTPQLRMILYGLEAGPPMLFVRALTIASEGQGEDPVLQVSVDVYGLMRKPGVGA